MKTLVKTSALVAAFTILATGVFATDKPERAASAAKQDMVLFTAPTDDVVGVIIHKAAAAKSTIAIYDKENNLVMKDVSAKNDATVLKGFNLTQLDNGDYTVKVITNNKEVKRTVHVYTNEDNQKSFLFSI